MSRYVRVTRGTPGQTNAEGLEPLRMALWDGGKEVDHVTAYSGAPGAQNFRTLANERRGVLEPCPEGVYRDIGGLEWAGGVGNYQASWSSSLGPVVAQIYGERAIMLHLDANRSYAPGSAGCLCPIDLVGLKKVVAWWTEGKPEWVECDWGLGTIAKPRPTVSSEPEVHRVKISKPAGAAPIVFRDGVTQPAISARLDVHDNKLGLALNGVQLPADQIVSVSIEVAYKAGK